MTISNVSDDFDGWAVDHDLFYPAGSRLDLEFRLSRMLILASRRWSACIDDAIRTRTGHKRAFWQTLFAVAFSGQPVTTSALAAQMGQKWPSLVRTLNELEANGLITRTHDPADGRSRFIEITDAGRTLLDDVQPVLDPARATVLQGLSGEELVEATRLMERILIGVRVYEESQ